MDACFSCSLFLCKLGEKDPSRASGLPGPTGNLVMLGLWDQKETHRLGFIVDFLTLQHWAQWTCGPQRQHGIPPIYVGSQSSRS